MEIEICSIEDAEKLASMNKRLIEDEKSTNEMTPDELEKRMRNFLGTDDIDIEVLSWNETGILFWKSLGFKDLSRYMRHE